MKAEYETITCAGAAAWHSWLVSHAANRDGIWLRIYKKASGVATVTYAEALDEALCFGWIDGLKRTYDDVSYVQKFTPRRKNSLWSKRNIEYVARLTAEGRMTPAGHAEVTRAQADGRWAAAYDKPSDMHMPEYFMVALRKHPEALAFFETLNKSSKYSIAWRLQTARTEATRVRRSEQIISRLGAQQLP